MKTIFNSPLVRLSFGLTMLTISILLLTDMLGIAPDTRNAELQSRKTIAEALAIQLSGQLSSQPVESTHTLLQAIVERSDNIISAAIRNDTDNTIVTFGNHNQAWILQDEDASTAENIRLPLYGNQGRWGVIELSFPLLPSVNGLMSNNFMTVIWFMIPFGFLAYFLFLKRALRELNPGAVIPDRVSTALDTLSEGLLILDEKGYIVFTNNAFAQKTGLTSKNLLGKTCSKLDWKYDNDTSKPHELPWNTIYKGEKFTHRVKAKLQTAQNKSFTFMINASAINSTGDNVRGVLITFDDITAIELKNSELKLTLDKLKKSQIEINDQNKELQILATRDPLTNILNRRSLFQCFEILFEDARSQNEELSCIMIDIDHFKKVNDNFGHATGDEVIVNVAKILLDNSRPNDLVGRYGGEEFCLILPNTSMAQSAKIAERIRQAVMNLYSTDHPRTLHLTASSGISNLSSGAISPSQLVDEADRALYKAKESGRNRCLVWPDMVDSLEIIGQSQQQEISKTAENATENAADSTDRNLKTELNVEDTELPVAIREIVPTPKVNDSTFPQHDSLLLDRISQATKRSHRFGTTVAVLILNIEKLKKISEILGIKAREKAANIALTRLRDILRNTDTISTHEDESVSHSVIRFNREEFTIILTDIDDIDFVSNIVQRIHKTLQHKIEIENHDFYFTSDIGISLYPNDSDDPGTLLLNASNALREARTLSDQNNMVYFAEDINLRSLEKIKMEGELHHAIERGELELFYQPKVDLLTGHILGMEALIRWRHPEMGLVMPNDFIGLAEKSGLIFAIGLWVVETACRQLKLWQEAGNSDLTVAVNLSAIEFRNKSLTEKILAIIKAAGVENNQLELEVTETAVVEHISTTTETLTKLRDSGISISIDDFGVGYSSLVYLQRFPATKVKIDRSFIMNLTENPNDSAIVAAVIAMSHSLGLRVVAEGVETEEQLRFLQDLQCDEMQGYLVSQPLQVNEMNTFLTEPGPIRHLITEYDTHHSGIITNFDNEHQFFPNAETNGGH